MDDAAIKRQLAEVSARLIRQPVETERLLLRPFREADFPDFAEYILQKEQQRLSGNPAISTEAEARELFDHILSPTRPTLSFAVELKREEKVVGNFSLGAHPCVMDAPETAGLRGVCLSCVLNERYWRRGLMKELFLSMIPWLFRVAGLDYINAGYFEFNDASRRLQESVGLRHWKQHRFERDGWSIPTYEMILFREDFLSETD